MKGRRAPILFAVDDDPLHLACIESELLRRYGGDYRIVCETSVHLAIDQLERMREADEDVVVVLADQWMPEMTGSDFLGLVRGIHPHAKRALLIDYGAWGDRLTAEAIMTAMALGRIDYYVVKPWRARDEQFHRMVAEFLHEWSREHSSDDRELVVVADPTSARGHEIRDRLWRSGVPHGFYSVNSAEAQELLGVDTGPGLTDPLIRRRDGKLFVNPTDEEIAAALGIATEPVGDPNYDVIVVGAGPAGLSAAVYASSEGFRTLVLERQAIGGQAGASSLIRNYLGFSRGVSGSELSQRAYQQAWIFGTDFAVAREAASLSPGQDRHVITCDAGYRATARAVILATGVSYRRLGIPAVEQFTGTGVFYGSSTVVAQGLSNKPVFVVGGGNSAGQAALHLARSSPHVTVLVRGASLAESMSLYLRDTIAAASNIEVRCESEIVNGGGEGHLEWLDIYDLRRGSTDRVPATALFVLIGGRPHTNWLPDEVRRDEAGYVLTGHDLLTRGTVRDTDRPHELPTMFETSVPGVYAIGDARHGSLKRVAAAVGDGSVVIRQVHDRIGAGARCGTPVAATNGSVP